MSMTVTCPNCNTSFEATAAIAQSVKEEMSREYNQKWAELARKKEEELNEQLRKREEEIVQQQKEKMQLDYDNKLKLLEGLNKQSKDLLDEAGRKELKLLNDIESLKKREEEVELELKRRLMKERTDLLENLKKQEEEKNKLKEQEFQMQILELKKQLDDQKKLADEMRRKAEQGSMQLQGEVQEIALEELLAGAFPFDMLQEVGKGVRGADCLLYIRNNYGQECGCIIFESKRTANFGADWIEKLKADMRTQGADVAVLVTKVMPRDMDCFGQRDGVWICSFDEVRALVSVLRDLIIRVHTASKREENKGDKMTMLYNYLVSHEFSEQWKAVREGFLKMKMTIQRERDQMEKLWKAREKELEKVLLNATRIQGSIEGIAGMEVDLSLVDDGDSLLLE
jgi:hypothetical protein